MKRTSRDWEQRVRMMPTASQIIELVDSHGWSAAHDRWSWVDHATLANVIKREAAMDPDQVPEDFEVEDLEP